MKGIINNSNAPTPVGHYSQGTVYKDLIFLAGQIPLDPKTNQVIGQDIIQQTRQVMENIRTLLQTEGADLNTVLLSTLYIKNMDEVQEINKMYGSFFDSTPPARVMVEVSRLPRDVLIEIAIIAHKQS